MMDLSLSLAPPYPTKLAEHVAAASSTNLNEGTSSNGQERRAPLPDLDLNKEPEHEPELQPEPELLPHDDSAEILNPDLPLVKVIHDLDEEDAVVDLLLDFRTTVQDNKVEVVVYHSNFWGGNVIDVDICDMHEGMVYLAVTYRVNGNSSSTNESSYGATRESAARGRKRPRSCTHQAGDHVGSADDDHDESTTISSSAEEVALPPNLRWKALYLWGALYN